MKVAAEIKVAVVVIVSLILLYFGYNVLKGHDIFSSTSKYYSIYQTVDGLTSGNPVQINGYTVGRISAIKFDSKRQGHLLVEIIISDPNVKVTKNATARIVNLDLLGSKAISLELDYSEPIYATSGDTLVGANQNSLQQEVNITILPLKMKAEELFSELDSAINIIQLILNEDARDNLSASFESLKRTFSTFEKVALRADTLLIIQKSKIDNVMTNFESISGNIKKSNDKITTILNNASSITDSLSKADIPGTLKTVDKTMKELSSVIEKVNKGEGSLGLLIKDDSLYLNIDQAMLELDKLLEDVRVNPRRYVNVSFFGKKDKDEQKPEKKDRSKTRKDLK